MKMTFVDMFCGAGLMSGGFKNAGFEPIYAVDANKHAVESYNTNIEDVAHCKEIGEPPADLKTDILIAGPPCQGFSTLGPRNPLDPRNNLAMLVADWAESLEAQIVVVENVKQFVKSENWSNLNRKMVKLGFHNALWELNSVNYKTPQYRNRCFSIYTKNKFVRTPRPDKAEINSRVVFEKPIREGDALHVWPTPSKLALDRMKVVPEGGDKINIMKNAPELCPDSWFALGHQALGVWGRIDRDKPSKTIRCDFQNPSKGRHVHPTENRVISLREGARIQGVPDSWEFKGSRTQIGRQIGNGVPVTLAEAVANSIAI